MIGAHLDATSPAALLNFPHHRNAGDSALWLAADQLVSDLSGGLRYRCGSNGFDETAFERAVPKGTIVLNAGGNLGDLYTGPGSQQALRERVMASYPGRPILQLPQSIHFRDTANRDRFARLVEAQGATTILCRDAASVEIAKSSFDATVAYCPDLVFSLGPLQRASDPQVDIVWLSRTDPERFHDSPPPSAEVEVVDWLHPLPGEGPWPPGRRARLAYRLNLKLLGGGGEPVRAQRGLVHALSVATFKPLAQGWVRRALEMLSRGRVVVTDRLHGHVLAFLAGIPSVVLDNSYGKVHQLIDVTTAASPLTHKATSVPEALGIARDLVRGGGAQP